MPNNIQLDLFTPISNNAASYVSSPQEVQEQQVDFYWQQFLPTVQKLDKERQTGKLTTGGNCYEWWRSRYYDYLTNNNSDSKNDAEWHYSSTGLKLFSLIWEKYSHIMTGYWFIHLHLFNSPHAIHTQNTRNLYYYSGAKRSGRLHLFAPMRCQFRCSLSVWKPQGRKPILGKNKRKPKTQRHYNPNNRRWHCLLLSPPKKINPPKTLHQY